MFNVMRIRKIVIIGVFITAFSLLFGCRQEVEKSVPEKPVVFVSNYPLMYIVERLAGDEVEIIFPVPSDEDPAFWEPTLEDIALAQSADLILFIGADYEKWAQYISLDDSKILRTGEPLKELWIETSGDGTHSHGLEGDHSHGGTAFTLWLDMGMARRMSAEAARGLTRILPESTDEIVQALESLDSDLEKQDAEYRGAIKDPENLVVLASHPVYQYFSRAYLPNLHAVLWEPDVYPEPAQWAELDGLLAETAATLMIWEGEPLKETQAALSERNLPWVVVDPCFNIPEEGEFISVMAGNTAGLADAGQGR